MSITDTGSPFPRHLPGAETVEFGPFRFDHAKRVLTRDGEEIRLPPRVVGLLQFLLERQGKVVSKQALIDGVWSGTAVTETSLTEAISVLRQALGDDAQDPRYLETVHRRGYRFRKAGVSPTGPPAVAAETAAAQPARTRALTIAGAIVVIIAIAVAIAVILWRSAPQKPKPTHVTIATVGELMEWSSLAISPNGRDVIYAAKQNGEAMLYHRSLDSFESRATTWPLAIISIRCSASSDWPGIGFYTVQAILTADYKVMLAVTLLVGVIYAAVNILVDLVHGLIDPRLREQL